MNTRGGHPIRLDQAQHTHFLGNYHEANIAMIDHMKALSQSHDKCRGCGQKHHTTEVKFDCSYCQSVFYCGKACQIQDFKGEKSTYMKHKLLCPLLQAWGNIGKREREN
eukprot:14245_1